MRQQHDDKRWEKTYRQLKTLRLVPATMEAKVRIIHTKIYAAAMYGVEAAEVAPAKVARLAAAVIDACRSKNDNHTSNRFFTALTDNSKDLDPVVKILARMVLQIRRTACKKETMADKFKGMILKYAETHKANGKCPSCFHPEEDKQGDRKRPMAYPLEQSHPTTKQHDTEWKDEIEAMGPVGLLIEAAIWSGLKLDVDRMLWQSNEKPIDIFRMPSQALKVAVQAAAARARSGAEWNRNMSKQLRAREIDREASQVNPRMTKEEQGMVSTVMMGGAQANEEIAGYNEDVDPNRTYFKKGPFNSGA